MRILLVEDNSVNRRVLGAMLRAGGFEMDEAEDGPAGLRMIDEADFDLVLMDLRMPGMDGITAIRHIRARADTKAGIPVVVITADAGSTIEAECRAAGADDLVLKPVSMMALFSAIAALIGAPGQGQAGPA
ncbi:MAG: response regulator [Phenylobacterium sp.]|nr:MAG: response regulator [Phenylobacterium sp.]